LEFSACSASPTEQAELKSSINERKYMKVNGIIPQPTADPRVFTLPSAPDPPESLQLFRNGVLQEQGEDFDLAGPQITYGFEISESDRMSAWYEAEA
jgi:hypothetical protein